jgi:hypothetical protein
MFRTKSLRLGLSTLLTDFVQLLPKLFQGEVEGGIRQRWRGWRFMFRCGRSCRGVYRQGRSRHALVWRRIFGRSLLRFLLLWLLWCFSLRCLLSLDRLWNRGVQTGGVWCGRHNISGRRCLGHQMAQWTCGRCRRRWWRNFRSRLPVQCRSSSRRRHVNRWDVSSCISLFQLKRSRHHD